MVRKMLLKTLSAALSAAYFLSSPVHASTLVQNGSFESFDTTKLNGSGWHVFNSIPGWSLVSGAGIEIQTNPTLPTIDAQDGRAYVELDSNNNSSMSQSLYLTTGNYLLSFFYSPRTQAANDNGIDYSIAGLSGTISGPSLALGTAVGVWTEISSVFHVATDGNYALNFGASGTSNSLGGLIDNVSVTVAAVPVPAAGLMLLGALGGLAGLRRKRRIA